MSHKVYLAGPISGLTYDEGQDWRAEAVESLKEYGIQAYSPLRRKEYLRKIGEIPMVVNSTKPLSTHKGIVTRDHFDVATADALLVNLLGAKIVSIGTMFELAWAWQMKKPVVVCMEAENIHSHAFVLETSGFIVPTLDEGVDTVAHILLP